jgi:hypothetical protein
MMHSRTFFDLSLVVYFCLFVVCLSFVEHRSGQFEAVLKVVRRGVPPKPLSFDRAMGLGIL